MHMRMYMLHMERGISETANSSGAGIRASAITNTVRGARSALVLLRLRGILSLAIGPSGAKRPTQNEQY